MKNQGNVFSVENLSKEGYSNFASRESFSKIFTEDENFDSLYPSHLRVKSARNWTKLEVVKLACDFLATEKNVHVLDIGSGVGKFCITAAHFKPNATFYGVEQRKNLVDYATDCSNRLGLYNVSFIHGNFTQLDLRQFDHFYFYNSFYENIVFGNKFMDDIDYSEELYNYYNQHLCKQLEKMPTGTKLVTFQSLDYEVPACYHVVHQEIDNLLKFWIKQS